MGDVQRDQNDLPLWDLPHPNDAQALRRYTETYLYDGVGRILELLDSIVNPTNPVAKGITDNLAKRGEALVNTPAAIQATVEKEGALGLAKAAGAGAHHLVKDTGEAAGDIVWEATHYQGDKSLEKISNRATDVVLNTADAVTLVEGGVGITKGGMD